MPKRPDYGLDAPGVPIALLPVGVAGQLVGPFAPPLTIGPFTIVFSVPMDRACREIARVLRLAGMFVARKAS